MDRLRIEGMQRWLAWGTAFTPRDIIREWFKSHSIDVVDWRHIAGDASTAFGCRGGEPQTQFFGVLGGSDDDFCDSGGCLVDQKDFTTLSLNNVFFADSAGFQPQIHPNFTVVMDI